MSIHKVLCLLHFMASKAQNYPNMISTCALLVSHCAADCSTSGVNVMWLDPALSCWNGLECILAHCANGLYRALSLIVVNTEPTIFVKSTLRRVF